MPVSWRPSDRRVRVVRRVHDVRPVDQGRDARVERLEGAPAVRGQHVVGAVVRRELVEDAPEVGDQREVRSAGPDRRLPGVAVGVDEARDDDVAGRVDDLRPVGRDVRPDGRDLVVLDQDARARQLSDVGVDREDDGILDQRSFAHCGLLCAASTIACARSTGRPAPAKWSVSPVLLCFRRRWSAWHSRQRRSRARRRPARRPLRMASRLIAAWGMSTPTASARSAMSRRSLAARSSENATGVVVGLDERGALVADERRAGGARGEDVVGGGAVDAGRLGEDEPLGHAPGSARRSGC